MRRFSEAKTMRRGALTAALLGAALSAGAAAAQSQSDPSTFDPVLDEILGAPQDATPPRISPPPTSAPPAAAIPSAAAPAQTAPPAAAPGGSSPGGPAAGGPAAGGPAAGGPAAGGPVAGGPAPRSAIPWLQEALGGQTPAAGAPSIDSNRITPLPPIRPNAEAAAAARPAAPGAVTDPSGAPYPGQSAAETPKPASAAATPTSIEVAPIEELDGSGAGLATAEASGLPVSAWRSVFPDQARQAMDQMKPSRFRTANRMGLRLLTASLPPPRGGGAALFRARLEALSRYGATREAALIARNAGDRLIAEGTEPALLSAEDAALCDALATAPGGGLPRIYCLILRDDFAGAQVALDAALALGGGAETPQDGIGVRLLEALMVGEPLEALDSTLLTAEPTPLRLAALRRLNAPAPPNLTRSDSLALVSATLSMTASPRQRLEALERLERTGAAQTDDLRLAFAAQTSAESGGVWGRVEAYQDATEAEDAAFLAIADLALRRAEETGRRASMARLLAADAAARSLPTAPSPEQEGAPELAVPAIPPPLELAAPAMRALLREGGEGGAAAALSRFALSAGDPAIPPDLMERALDHLAAPTQREDPDEPWTEHWSDDDAEDLAELAAKGDARAAFLVQAIAVLDAPAPTAFERRPGQLAPGGVASPAEEIADGRAGLLLARSLGPLGAAEPTDRDVLRAVETARALGWEREARALALEAAMARR